MYSINSLPSQIVCLNGKELLWFSGTAYLGMGHLPVFEESITAGQKQYGFHWGSSRNNTLQLAVYEEAELALAGFVGSEAALTMSSGMLAGQALMRWVDGFQHPVFHAPRVHPALWGSTYEASNDSLEDWFEALPARIAESTHQEVFIVSDSVGSPHPEKPPLAWLERISPNKKVNLLLDDSHGIGVLGSYGKGIFSEITCPPNVELLVVASLNKALGLTAGAIFGQEAALNNIRQSPFFSGSSPAAPGLMWALPKVLPMITVQHQKLMWNTAFFQERIADLPLCWMDEYPVFTSVATGLHEFLLENGILTASFPYPSLTDPIVTRLVVSALHTQEDLQKVANATRTFFEK